MSKSSRNKVITTPEITQIQSGEIKNPPEIEVTTVMVEFREGLGFIRLATKWRINYSEKELQFVGGILRVPLIVSPILPFQVPDSHIRAARKITAATFGRKRFRGRVRMYEEYHKEVLYQVSHEDKTTILTDRDDALLWGLENGYNNPKVRQLSLEEAKMLYPMYDLSELITMAQKNSLRLKAEPMRHQLQKIMCMSADDKLDEIKRTGYNIAPLPIFALELVKKFRS